MNYLSAAIKTLSVLFILFMGMQALHAQYVSPYKSNGTLKTIEERRYEESRNNQNKYTPPPATSKPSSKPAAPPSNSVSYTPYDAAAVAKAAAEEKTAKLIKEQKKQAFLKKVAQYHVTDYSFFEGGRHTPFSLNGKYGFLNVEGDPVIAPVYDATGANFPANRAWVKSGNKYGFIDYTGKLVIPLIYDSVDVFKQVYDDESGKVKRTIAYVKLKGKYGYIDENEIPVIPIIYDYLEVDPCCYRYAAKLNGKWGFVNNSGKASISFNLDTIISTFTYPKIKTAENSDWTYFKLNSARATVVKNMAKFTINPEGTVVGNKIHVVTGAPVANIDNTVKSSFTDTPNNIIYQTIKIGDQVWMSQNLDNERFANGDIIPQANSEKAWKKAVEEQKPAWCYYDNNSKNGKKYGKLYNWYAVIDQRGLAPAGWHIPDYIEWRIMLAEVGGIKYCAPKLKHAMWSAKEEKGLNESGFSAFAGGCREDYNFMMKFNNATKIGYWWSSSVDNTGNAYYFSIKYYEEVTENFTYYKGDGFSVRCIKQVD